MYLLSVEIDFKRSLSADYANTCSIVRERTHTAPVHNPEEEMWVQWHHWRTDRPKLKDRRNITLTIILSISIGNASRLYGACHQTNVPTNKIVSKAKLNQVTGSKPTTLTAYVKTLIFASKIHINSDVSLTFEMMQLFLQSEGKKWTIQSFHITEVSNKRCTDNWQRIKWRTNEDTFDASHCSELLHVVLLFRVFVLCLCVQDLLLGKPTSCFLHLSFFVFLRSRDMLKAASSLRLRKI